ncbi:MAG: hypothetical protein AB1611_11295 [bacterium]
MHRKHQAILRSRVVFLVVVMTGVILATSLPAAAQVQNWVALPPYDTLWPLWSPALSPIDPVSGDPIPLVTNLEKTTVLPAQPGLTWDPAWSNPWLLYNTPAGMLFYDPLYGINPWPPDYLIDPVTGLPQPITLPSDYDYLPPTSSSWILTQVPIANTTYLSAYAAYAPPAPLPVPLALLLSLLSAGTTPTLPTIPALPPASTTLLGPAAILGI